MALITCPECGKQVSSFADKCPECGFPISQLRIDGVVRIKLQKSPALNAFYIYNEENGELLWSGYAGSMAEFTVQKDTKIQVSSFGKYEKAVKYSNVEEHAVVHAGDKYNYTYTPTFFGGRYSLVKVDVIDSE